MTDDTAISVKNVSKCYRVFDNQRSRLLHALWPSHAHGMQEVWALQDINFDIKRGESVAIIGRNGGGKSTLLEILTGTLTPTTGTATVHGRVSALLELGSGFNPEFSGRENVILNGLLLGLSRDEILARFGEIEAFAEIGDAIDRPVKTYSTGMMMRLAFSVQVLLDPQILIVDEALGVGDFFFQQKCFARLRQMKEKGLTLLFVSHDMGTVRDLCQRALYLRNGKAEYFGEVSQAIRLHMQNSSPAPTLGGTQTAMTPRAQFEKLAINSTWCRYPEGDQRLMTVHIVDTEGNITDRAKLGSSIRLQVSFLTGSPDEEIWLSLVIKNRYDQIVTSTSSRRLGIDNIGGSACDITVFEFEVDLMLEAGLYTFRINFGHNVDTLRGAQADSTGWIGPFQIHWDYQNDEAPFLGLFGVPVRGRLK